MLHKHNTHFEHHSLVIVRTLIQTDDIYKLDTALESLNTPNKKNTIHYINFFYWF